MVDAALVCPACRNCHRAVDVSSQWENPRCPRCGERLGVDARVTHLSTWVSLRAFPSLATVGLVAAWLAFLALPLWVFRPARHPARRPVPVPTALPVAEAAKSLGLTSRLLPSGAGHDAQAMAQLGPMGMIFIPSVGGISHSPKEFSRPNDIVNGANVLLATLLRVDEAAWS